MSEEEKKKLKIKWRNISKYRKNLKKKCQKAWGDQFKEEEWNAIIAEFRHITSQFPNNTPNNFIQNCLYNLVQKGIKGVVDYSFH